MRFVRSLRVDAFHFPGTIEGIDLAPILDTLFWEARMAGPVAPLAGLLMPALKSLDLDVTAALSAEDRRALCTVAVPKLRKLNLYLSTVDQAEILETVVASPWFGALESASISLTKGHALAALIRLEPSKRRLSIFLPPGEMKQQRAGLRKSFPNARLTVLPSGVRSDSDNCPRVHDKPKRAPQNYKDLDPWIILAPEKDWGRRVQMGSGIPFGSLERSLLSLCGSCASEDTLCIFHETAVSYGEDHTAHYENWECECRECGLFTQYVNNRYT